MSSGPSDYRRRSRSPVGPVGDIARLLNEQSERFSEHLRRNRRGKRHKRTSKRLLLTLLEYYLYIIQFAADASGHAASYVRRRTQISDTWNAVKYNRWFPREGDPLLLRAENSDLESEHAETAYPPPRRPREPDRPPDLSSSTRVVPRASSAVTSEVQCRQQKRKQHLELRHRHHHHLRQESQVQQNHPQL